MSIEQESGVYVSRFYEMDPRFEDMIYGADLRDGMIVLIDDGIVGRSDPLRMDSDPYEYRKCRVSNRWCTVTKIEVHQRFGHGPLVRFMGVYADGTKAPRAYDASYCWLVKRESMQP